VIEAQQPTSAALSVEELLLCWQERRDRGQSVSPEELCAGRPELLAELQRRVQALASMQAFLGGPGPGGSETPPPGQAGAQRPRGTEPDGPGPASPAGDTSRTCASAPACDPDATRGPLPPDPDATKWPSQAAAGGTREVPGYEILGELGRGGMGVVYRARQTGLGRTVALKMILAGAHAAPAERARFKAEAQAVARLQHPNIVQVHEVGEHQGLPFFSLEYCPGGSLAQKFRGEPLPAREAARLVGQLARALQAAHEAHVIHRDLKPANILLAAGGTPKVTDFGLAKRLDEAGQTQSGAVMGTPSYMAPEQAAGKTREIGPAADVYALGAILYELLTGRPPFKAASSLDTIRQVVSDEPVAPSRLNRGVPRDLETVCLRCLRKEPARRYGSARELEEDLGRFLEGRPVKARRVTGLERGWMWARRRPALAALAAVIVLATVGLLAGWVVWLNDARVQAEQHAAEQQKLRKEADKQKGNALREADKATRARDFLVSILRISETDAKGGNVTARQILADAEKRIPVEFADQPQLRAELVKAIGEVKRGIARRVPQAMILEVRGTVKLQSAAGVRKAAVPQALLNLDEHLTLSADAQVELVFLADLHKERLKQGREVTIDSKGCKPAEAILQRDDGVLMTFVRLPKGTFYMGWDGQKKGVRTEIRDDFEIAVHDVTQGQWQAVMGNNPSWFSRQGGGRRDVVDISDEELKLFPVEGVSWDDAQEFLKRLNEKERGRGYLYRLPTEAEWEYACRGGATSEEECSYHFYFARPTNDLSSEQANFNGGYPFGKAAKGKFLGHPTRVGAYPSNKLGLCDMHGNVWQWCADVVPYVRLDRVGRGGSWGDFGIGCRAANPGWNTASTRSLCTGFRLARVPVR
jgi:formylglycine-generating enzyme required for sulfatase activity